MSSKKRMVIEKCKERREKTKAKEWLRKTLKDEGEGEEIIGECDKEERHG